MKPFTAPSNTPEPGGLYPGVPINRNPPPPPPVGTKPKKRQRKPWVYKEDYDKLKEKKNTVTAIAGMGWLLLILYIAFDVVTNV